MGATGDAAYRIQGDVMLSSKVASTRGPSATAVVLKSRSGDLLRRIIALGGSPADDVRRELGMTPDDFDAIVTGTRVMSLPHQLCFAAFLIERVPALARPARTLRQQALAAMEYGNGTTATHASQPLKWSRLR
jgi:hypothetical protein